MLLRLSTPLVSRHARIQHALDLQATRRRQQHKGRQLNTGMGASHRKESPDMLAVPAYTDLSMLPRLRQS
jgi:hypothetical protein